MTLKDISFQADSLKRYELEKIVVFYQTRKNMIVNKVFFIPQSLVVLFMDFDFIIFYGFRFYYLFFKIVNDIISESMVTSFPL